MKAKINIEIFDKSTLQECEAIGFGMKAMETLYTVAFDNLLKQMCTDGAEYSLSVVIEENTTN